MIVLYLFHSAFLFKHTIPIVLRAMDKPGPVSRSRIKKIGQITCLNEVELHKSLRDILPCCVPGCSRVVRFQCKCSKLYACAKCARTMQQKSGEKCGCCKNIDPMKHSICYKRDCCKVY